MRAPAAARERRWRALLVLLGLYVAVLGFFLLAPTSTTPSSIFYVVSSTAEALGLPAGVVTTRRVEFLANVLVFVPVLAAVMVLRPRTSWVAAVALGFAASLAVELVQAVFLSARWATISDVVANTVGAALGAAIGVWLRGRRPSSGP